MYSSMNKIPVIIDKAYVLVRKVLAVVCPGTLLEQWQALQTIIEADCVVIMQAANTGLTGGSTPYGDEYDRPVIIMSNSASTRHSSDFRWKTSRVFYLAQLWIILSVL